MNDRQASKNDRAKISREAIGKILDAKPGELNGGAAGTVGMKPENQVRNCWLPTQRMAPGRPTSANPHQNHATKWTYQKHLRASCTERLSFWIFVIWPKAQPTWCILSVFPLGNDVRHQLALGID